MVFIAVASENITHFPAFTLDQLPLLAENAISPFYKWETETQEG